MVWVDLGRGSDRVQWLTSLLAEAANEHLTDPDLPRQEIQLRSDYLPFVAEACFLLGDAYALQRGVSGGVTDPQSLPFAAMTALAIQTLKPIRAVLPENVRDVRARIACPLYAIGCAHLLVGRDLGFTSRRLTLLCNYLLATEASSLSEYLAHLPLGQCRASYDVPIERDLANIDVVMLVFDIASTSRQA